MPICALAVTLLFVHGHFERAITSDHASELILAKLLAQEGGLLSPNWYYSTELRVLNTNIVYSLLFRLTDNWHAVRLLSYAVMGMLLLFSVWLYGRSIGHECTVLALGTILMLPFASEYYELVLEGGYYFPHLTITFLTLALRNLFSSDDTTQPRRTICALLGAVVAILAGMGGLRQLAILYIPLFVSDVVVSYLLRRDDGGLKDARRAVRFSSVLFLASIVGYLVNSLVLSGTYHFRSYEDLSFVIQDADRVAQLLRGLLLEFGFVEQGAFSPALIRNAVAIGLLVSFVVALVYALRNAREVDATYLRMAVFAACAIVIHVSLYTLTGMPYASRYWIPLVVLAVPCLAHLLVHACEDVRVQRIAVVLVVVCVTTSALLFYKDRSDYDPAASKRDVVQYLLQEGYAEGYATFWNANVLTELSNGEIEVWDWAPSGALYEDGDITRLHDVDQRYRWLQLVEHDETHPTGRVFALFSSSEYEHNSWCLDKLGEDIVFQNTDYVILGYENHDELMDHFYRHYEYGFTDDGPTADAWVSDGRDTPFGRLLEAGGRSWGPYITLPEGHYVLTIDGEGIDALDLQCTSDNGQSEVACTLLSQGPNQIVCSFELSDKTEKIEVVLDNTSEEDVLVNGMVIERNKE